MQKAADEERTLRAARVDLPLPEPQPKRSCQPANTSTGTPTPVPAPAAVASPEPTLKELRAAVEAAHIALNVADIDLSRSKLSHYRAKDEERRYDARFTVIRRIPEGKFSEFEAAHKKLKQRAQDAEDFWWKCWDLRDAAQDELWCAQLDLTSAENLVAWEACEQAREAERKATWEKREAQIDCAIKVAEDTKGAPLSIVEYRAILDFFCT